MFGYQQMARFVDILIFEHQKLAHCVDIAHLRHQHFVHCVDIATFAIHSNCLKIGNQIIHVSKPMEASSECEL